MEKGSKRFTPEQKQLIWDMFMWDNPEWDKYLKSKVEELLFINQFLNRMRTKETYNEKERVILKKIRDEYIRLKKLNL